MKTITPIAGRMASLFASREFRKLPALLLTAQPNIFYFTGFTGHDSWAVLTGRKTFLFTDGRYTLQARQECPQARILVRKGSMVPFFADAVARTSIRKIGFLVDELTIGLLDRLVKACKKIRWQPAAVRPVQELRESKSHAEVRTIGKALVIAQEAYMGLIHDLKAGVTERQAAAELEYRMRLLGAEKASFDTIIACGPNGAKPHARTSDIKLVRNRPIVIDFGALADGYCSDLTRTVCLGTMPTRFKDVYKVCLEAQLAGIAAVKPGVRTRDVDAVARAVIAKAGYGKFFNHGLGHGLGLDVHESPYLSPTSEQVLRPGMIVTVEPGIYLPGQGGVRIEDDVRVTETGHEVLSALPKELKDVQL